MQPPKGFFPGKCPIHGVATFCKLSDPSNPFLKRLFCFECLPNERKVEAKREIENMIKAWETKSESAREEKQRLREERQRAKEEEKQRAREEKQRAKRKRHTIKEENKELKIKGRQEARESEDLCNILTYHHDILEDDPDRLSTDFIIGLIADTKEIKPKKRIHKK